MIRKKAIHRSDAQWREILAHQVASGASVKDFCKQNNVTVSGFYAARKRLNVQLTDLPLSDIEQEKPVGCGSFLTTNQAARFSTGRAYFSK